MACRLQSIPRPCGYNLEGISDVYVIDTDDFQAFKFDGDDLYKDCKVIQIAKIGDFTTLPAPVSAKYTSSLQNGYYTHTLETFITSLSGDILANQHLATKRRYIVIFRTNNGNYFTFGYTNGATYSYANQTTESTGTLITLTGVTPYPLFEVTAEAMTDTAPLGFEFVADFTNYTYCVNA